MTAILLLQQLEALAIIVTLTPSADLSVKAPRGVLTDTLRLAIRTHKAALVELLQPPTCLGPLGEDVGGNAPVQSMTPSAIPDDLREWYDERRAIMAVDGGLSPEDADREAWACLQAYSEGRTILMAHPDSLVRIALSTWLTAADSGLTETQQGWLRTRLQSTAPLTPGEKAKLKAPLLAWCTRRGIREKVAAQLEGDIAQKK